MNSDSEIHFIVDEELVKLENILKGIQFRLENPELEKNKLILQSFVTGCIKACKKVEKPAPPVPIPLLEKPGKVIKEIKKIPKKKKVFPVPVPKGKKIKDFKTKVKFRKEEL